MAELSESQRRFARSAVRRERVFLVLSIVGVAVALGLSIYYGYRYATRPGYGIGPRAVIVLLVLLNARQNLRQYRYAGLLRDLALGEDPLASVASGGAGGDSAG